MNARVLKESFAKAKAFAEESNWHYTVFVKEWNGFYVFFTHPEEPFPYECYGYPTYILVKEGMDARIATPEECCEIMASF